MSEEDTYGAPKDQRGAMDEGQQRQHAVWRRESERKHIGCVLKVLNGKHIFILGSTGSGKTFWMAKVADTYLHRFIFINTQMEVEVDKICSSGYDEPGELLEGVLDGEKAIQFVPDEDDDVALLQLEEIRRGLFEMAAEMHIESGTFWMNLIVDEIQEFAWKGSRNDIDNLFRRGRRFGIRGWGLSQRPQNVSSTIINNISHQVIFRTGGYESPYFKTYKIPIEEHEAWLKKDYHYLVYDNYEMLECIPIEEG
jgi:DNA helicase HerA-like ATPase